MQSTNQPGKFLIPFAQNDSAKAEIPVTSADPTRMSQSLGSPPLTGQPPEAGGVPPQLPDFNGAMNQVARGPWWFMAGGRFGFDATWAGDSNIGGYPRGAVLPAALGSALIGMGEWYNNTEDNLADPDVTGTGWVPGYHYGSTALAGQTGGTVTLTPAQAAKRVITVAGTLTSNLVLVVPGWVYDWTVHNNTGGAFTVTVKNAATAGVLIPQNGAPTPVRCDGTTVSLWSPNIGPATSSTQAARFDQTVGRLINTQTFTTSGTYTPTPGTTRIKVTLVGGGGGGGGTGATGSGQAAVGVAAGAGGYAIGWLTVPGAPTAVTVGAGGTAGTGSPLVSGGNGGTSSFLTLSATGGGGGQSLAAVTPPTVVAAGTGGTGTGGNISNGVGGTGGGGFALVATSAVGGTSGSTLFGGGAYNATIGDARPGQTGGAPGAGAAGAVAAQSRPAQLGAAGAAGIVIIEEYS